MYDWSKLLPLIAAALFGWLFSEGSNVIRLRREEHRAIGRALSDLIIIRRHILAVKEIVKKVRELNKFSPREQLFFQIAIDLFIPKDEGLQSRYEESMRVMTGIKPLLGYELVSQGQLLSTMGTLKQLSATNDDTASAWEELAGHIEDTSYLDDLIIRLAWSHGWRTWFGVKRHLRTPLRDLPENVIELLKREGSKKLKS